jgi:hypothetical protein
METSDWLSRLMPRTLNAIMLSIASFLMLFLLIRRYDQAKRKNHKFWARETFTETFVHLLVWVLTVVTFMRYMFFGGEVIDVGPSPEDSALPFLIPATAYSIVLSVVAFGTFLATLLHFFSHEEREHPPIRGFLLCFLIIFVFLGMRYAILVLAPPWGEPLRTLVNLTIDVCVFGLLVAYVLAGTILFMVRAMRGT